MPKLILLRHGKSDWTGEHDDIRRPLSSRGRRNARTMGRLLTRTAHVPDAVLTSPAERAFQTARLAMEAGEWSCPLREADALYEPHPAGVINAIRRESASVQLLLAVGHEPAWSSVVAELIGGGEVRMPTGAMACIDLGDTRWTDVGAGKGVLTWLLTPRLVNDL